MPSSTPARLLILSACMLCFLQISSAQSYWESVREDQIAIQPEKRLIRASAYHTFALDLPAMRSVFAKAPLEKPGQDNWSGAMPIDIPMPDGSIMRFELLQRLTMHPDLMAKFPLICNGIVRSVSDPSINGVVDVTYEGFHAMLFTQRYGTVFIDPLMHLETNYYMAYRKADFETDKSFTCQVEGKEEGDFFTQDEAIQVRLGNNQLRTYRICIAATGEYTAFHGGTVAGALSGINTSNNRVSGLLTKEFAIALQIIANNNLVVFTNANTDPYTNDDGFAMLDENQATLDATIGNANYHMGHVFSTGGGGVAATPSVCDNTYKAQGVTGSGAPVGDPFDIDYVAHEMGHQFSGNHTQYNACQRNNATSWEPGSASTIMGYAGICAPDVQSNSDPYYHVGSMTEISNYVNSGTGNSCPVKVTLANQEPVISSVPVYYNIPRSTPFELTAVGNDPDGTSPYYCWEQMNIRTAPSQTMPPAATNVSGPMFRSYNPTTSPTRTFPQLSSILSGANGNTWEVLPSVDRTLNFRVSSRDWAISGGRSDTANAVVRVFANAGPFVISNPNTSGISYSGGSSQTITWAEASTSGGSVNCAFVDILLSLDGGQTFPYVLFDNAVNDGSQAVIIPNQASTTARIKIKGDGNIFFDINNFNFTIVFNPLPVSLTHFSGEARKEGNQLFWEAAAELNLSTYEIQRASNGIDYRPLSQVNPKGSETKAASYAYLDTKAGEGNNYYRLKMVDHNGDFEYSNQIILQQAGLREIAVFPNPASDALHLRWNQANTLKHIELINTLGQKVLEAEVAEGAGDITLSVSDLPAGAYYLRLDGENQPIPIHKK